MILTPEILAILILDGLFLVFGTIALINAIKIYSSWDISKTTQYQYNLEKKAALGATIVKYIFAIKIPLFLFFIFTIDNLSTLLTGAMCAAGVVDATTYGVYLFIVKIINLYIFGFWLMLHKADISQENIPFTKLKFGLFIFAYGMLVIEILLEVLMFANLDPAVMVSCCGTLFSSTSSSYISSFFTVDPTILLSLFYFNFLLLVVIYFFKNNYFYAISSLLFIIISMVSLISWFGTYIYELPTHHCPFCFLQKEYYYIGYLLYSTLFAGTFFGLSVLFSQKQIYFKLSILFNTIYTLIVTAYPTIYYIKNGVWLQ